MPRPLLYSSLILALTCGAAFAEDQKPAGDMEKVTFVDHVLPIFRAKCGSCHNANDKRGGLVLDNYSAMMLGGSSGTSIEPGDAGNSYLWNLITHASEPKMPPNADKLPAEQLAVIEKWINLGALENSGSKANVKKKPALGKIEVSNSRPADVAMPQLYYGEPQFQSPRTNAVTALATSPWASLVAVSGFKQIGVYDSKSLDLLGVLPFPEGRAQIAKFSRDGSLLLVGGGRGGESGRVVVYDVRTGERKVELGDEYDEVLGADISADQTLIALGGPKKILRIYSIETGEQLHEMKKHTDWITAVEFSPDGVLVASGDRANGLVVWESGSGQLFYDLQGHKGSISDISWRPDSNVVASASEDGTVKMWEMQNGGLVKSFDAHGGGVTALEYTREGELVTTGRDRLTRYWKGDGAKIRDLPATGDIAMEVAFDAETKRILTGDWLGLVTIWNAEDGAQVGQINTNPPTVNAQIAQATAKMDQLRAQLQSAQGTIAGIQKGIDDRTNAATAAAGVAAKAAEGAKAAAAAKQNADADLKAKQAALATSEKAVKESQAALALLKTQLQQNADKVTAMQGTVKTLNDALVAANTAQQSAIATVTDLTTKAEAAVKAAEPTEAEKPVLESDEAVNKAVAERQAAAQAALEAVKAAQAQLEAANAKVTEAKQQVETASANLKGAEQLVKTDREQEGISQKGLDAATQTFEAARKTVMQSEAAVAAAVQAEQGAAKVAADAQAAAQKAAEAAKVKEDEQKAKDAAQAIVNATQAQIAEVEAKLARLQKLAGELSASTQK